MIRAISSFWARHQRKISPYLFVAPFFVLFAVFLVYPVIYSFILSFYDARGLGARTFTGLENYRELLIDPRFRKAVVNTTYYAAGSVFFLSPLALLLALALNTAWLKLKGLFRVAFFIPVITSEVVVAVMFTLVFEQDYGLLNALLRSIGLDPIPWLRSPAWAMPSIILLGVWIWAGLNALYFLAGLQNIDQEYYEAAAIDGANSLQLFRYITVPLLKPVILFVVIQAIVGSYQLFTQPWILTSGGPQDATLTVTMYLYLQAFRFFNLGYASAIGYALVVIILTLSLIQLIGFGTFRREDA